MAGLSMLSSKLVPDSQGAATNKSAKIPPHKNMIVPGVHGYAEQTVAAGEKLHFRISGTVPHRLSIYRLGLDPESPSLDELLHQFPESPVAPQPIHPGSYVQVEKNIRGSLKALTLECWVRRWKVSDFAGLITQYDNNAKEFGLFIGSGGALSFCVGDKAAMDDAKLQISSKAGLKTNVWYHIAAVWDGKHRSIFINGKQIAKWPCKTQLNVGKAPLRLGAFGEAGAASGVLDGDLAMPVIYRRALSENEIIARYEQKALVPIKGRDVLACWKFDEERGERVADFSGSGRDGRIINHATWMIPGPSFNLFEVIRFASYDPKKDSLRGHALRLASDDLYDCRWNVTHEFTVPTTARSGLYVGRVAYKWEGKPHFYHITFIVRKRARKKKAPILLLASTNTWRAYSSAAFPKPNAALKKNVSTAGQANSPGDPPAFSFYRRHAAGQGGFQIGLNMPFSGADPYLLYGAEYSHLVRADRFAQVWLEKSGYDYDVITDLDLHRDPEILSGYRTVIINGHSEYWSLPACQGLDKFLRRGGNAVVLSGNTMLWRVSFNEDGSVIECRKVDAGGEQMKPEERGECWHSHDGMRGGHFRECGPPSYKLIGLDMLGWAGEAAFGPYVVDQADHFLFHQPEETGLKAGDEFGQAPDGKMQRANGHEVDIRMSTFAALQEQPTPVGAVVPTDPPGMTRIANGITKWSVSGSAFDYFWRPIKPKVPQGAEMIFWERPEGGKVFNAGAIASGWAMHADPKFQTLMRNVLAHFGVSRP